MKKAIKQSKLVFLVNLVTVVLLIAILASLGVTTVQSKKADKMNDDRFKLTENATVLMGASSYLTSEIRAYSATGNKVHYDNYMNEMNQRKSREDAMNAIKSIGVTATEKSKIDEMMAISSQLELLEKQAMEDVNADNLKDAVQTVLGVTYNDQVTKMVQLKTEFLNMLVKRTSDEVDKGVLATRMLELQSIILIIIIILLRFYSYNVIRKKVIAPILAVEEEMRRVATGDLSTDLDLEPNTSEIGMLIDSILTTKKQLRKYIGDISEKLTLMANQDFSISVDIEYNGDFLPIKNSLNQIISSLNRAMSQINDTAEIVSIGSSNVSASAQDVAQGTSAQTASIEEISETVSTISLQVQETSDQSCMATELATAAGVQLNKSNEQLQGMLKAMNEISDASGEIGKIVKTIEDIAFQTNILALNAAVEAARAGAAGKGFAVVADEVRNLATKSAEASKNTSIMIENSLNTIKSGAKIATEASDTFVTVMINAGRAADAMGAITISSKEQALSISRVSENIEQISNVIIKNSTNSEESAETSEQLMTQATELRELVHQFKLKNY